jgi:hypothetical protein
MFSSTLALFTRSFRVDARSTRPHILRLLFACAVLLELVWTHEMEVQYGAPGLTVFIWIAWLNFAVISLAGIGYFATAISEEKEEESLGLLKMAGISPVALLLGKSTSRLISVLLLLAVEFPFVLLSITLGGVTMNQVIAMAISLAAYLVFVANLALFCSVLASSSRRASTMVTLTLVALLIVVPILGQVALAWATIHPADTLRRGFVTAFARWEDQISMWSRISTIKGTGFDENPISPQVMFHLVAALGLFGLSWACFERFTRERHAVGRRGGTLARSFQKSLRGRMGRAWSLALTWKDFNLVCGGKRMLAGRFCVYFALIGGLFWLVSLDAPNDARYSQRLLGATAMITMTAVAAIELSLIAGRVFHEELKANTLPLLIMLPKTPIRIAIAKVACAVPTLLPALTYFLLGAVLNFEDFKWAFDGIFTSWVGWYCFVWFILFLHLATYTSLVVRWGALPLSIFLVFFSQMILIPLFTAVSWYLFGVGSQNEDRMMACLLMVSVVAIAVLAYAIPRRLRKLAVR